MGRIVHDQKNYDNGLVDVTTLQGESLGRVNMNKLKPYQELDTTQTYALENFGMPQSGSGDSCKAKPFA